MDNRILNREYVPFSVFYFNTNKYPNLFIVKKVQI